VGLLCDWQIEKELEDKIKPFSPMQNRPGIISYGLSSMGYDARLGYKFKKATNVHCGVVDPKNFDPKNFVEVDLSPPTSHDFIQEPELKACGPRCSRCGVFESNPYVRTYDKNCFKPKVDHILIPPNSFILGETMEEFDIPRSLLAVVLGKSTYARSGLIVNVTPGEPEWKGKWTVEITNSWPLPAKVYPGEGIMQILFLRTDGHSEAVLNAVRRLCGQKVQQDLHSPFTGDDNVGHLSVGDLSMEFGTIEQLLHRELAEGTCRVSYADKAGIYQNQPGLTDPRVRGKE
jgi:dCTP deaminase